MKSEEFYTKFNEFYSTYKDSDTKIALAGDKAYVKVATAPPGSDANADELMSGTKVFVCQSAKTVEGADELLNGRRPDVRLSSDIQKFRSVVERVIGRMKAFVPRIRGPVSGQQRETVMRCVELGAIISNMCLDQMPSLYARDKGES